MKKPSVAKDKKKEAVRNERFSQTEIPPCWCTWDPPPDLDEVARYVWDAYTKVVDGRNLTPPDPEKHNMLAALCRCYSIASKAQQCARDAPLIVRRSDGLICANPLGEISRDAWKDALQLHRSYNTVY